MKKKCVVVVKGNGDVCRLKELAVSQMKEEVGRLEQACQRTNKEGVDDSFTDIESFFALYKNNEKGLIARLRQNGYMVISSEEGLAWVRQRYLANDFERQ